MMTRKHFLAASSVLIGAVLGPTALGNTYQLTNNLPNLLYYGFLAGSLFSSVLVPHLVADLQGVGRVSSTRLAGAFSALRWPLCCSSRRSPRLPRSG